MRDRREFLKTASAWITTSLLATESTGASLRLGGGEPVTGEGDPRTAPYDRLMTDFMSRYRPPGAALAVTKDRRLVYARGFGVADREERRPVEPTSLFRIASLTKPFTSVALLQLVEAGRLGLDDKVFQVLGLQPHVELGARPDPRLFSITVRQCLQHTGGWDRDKSFDPMSATAAERIAKALRVSLPIQPEHIIRYMMGRSLDSDPGTTYAYSNFGYCLLGRVIEAVSEGTYRDYVTSRVLKPLGITGMRLGKNLLKDRAPGEVRYYDSRGATGRAISGPHVGEAAPLPYGVECLETMDANGGWIASAVMLVRFADALNDMRSSPLLGETSLRTMLARPTGAPGMEQGKPSPAYYGCGWQVRPRGPGFTKWHIGLLSGTSTLLVCRADRINWAVLFNSDASSTGEAFAPTIDRLLHQPADEIKDWPIVDLYPKYPI